MGSRCAGVRFGQTRRGAAGVERFPAKWGPVRVKKTRQIKNLEPRSDFIIKNRPVLAGRFSFGLILTRRRRSAATTSLPCGGLRPTWLAPARPERARETRPAPARCG